MLYKTRFTQSVSDKVSALHPDIKKLLKVAIKEISVKPYIGKNCRKNFPVFRATGLNGIVSFAR